MAASAATCFRGLIRLTFIPLALRIIGLPDALAMGYTAAGSGMILPNAFY